MALDLKRLRRDVDRLSSEANPSPIGRVRTGATGIVRAHLDELRRMHDEGASWVSLAAGLAAQGVTQGDGQPLTGRRLTALIHSIEKAAIKKATRVAGRARRPDIRSQQPEPSRAGARLAPELQETRPADSDDQPLSEDEIRAHERVRQEHLFKKD